MSCNIIHAQQLYSPMPTLNSSRIVDGQETFFRGQSQRPGRARDRTKSRLSQELTYFQCLGQGSESESSLSCLTLCDSMEYTVQGILQVRILEWVVIAFSRASSQFRNQTQVSHIAHGFFTSWDTREAQEYWDG